MLSGLGHIELIFTLLVVFQIKHWIGDFLLQTAAMVSGKARPGLKFVRPLGLHAGIHAVMTLAIVLVIEPRLWFLGVFDFTVHFIMDRIKSAPGLLGRYTDISKRSFWIPLGLDQLVHHLTHYAVIFMLFKYHASG